MKGSFLPLLLAYFATTGLACQQPTRHYISMGCTPSEQKDEEGCPLSYDCPNLKNRQNDKCYLYGKTYSFGDSVPMEETSSSCIAGLGCIPDGLNSRFIYAHIDCAEFFRPYKPDCVRQYAPNKCCSSGEVCGEVRDKLAKCTVGGHTYYEGERMPVPDNPCKSCICSGSYDKHKFNCKEHCYETKCTFEIYNKDKLFQGAVPVYKDGVCCPWSWRLPADTDKLVKGANSNPELQCKYGKLTLNVGDSLEPFSDTDGTVKCSCAIPPLVHCKLG
ncbi:uncharacterized protein LOC129770622 [Toxorhynchites rutilus septentrionalis]|uniref:uncharacterized protein LOC129770622 n=1 Tax=Toxorhynchites rutilus septentrionalis TaxID=329112 RepID=UPI002478E486|nr:uncharacterized protein LOC129770622 [Toxorhynchites rutilus septentrionalis]